VDRAVDPAAPINEPFAAFTIASTRWVVRSPSTTAMSGAFSAAFFGTTTS